MLGSIQPQPIEFEPDGSIDLAKAQAKIKPDNEHFAMTKLLALENTTDGMVLSMDYLAQAHDFARGNELSLHLDGARLWNAVGHLGIDEAEVGKLFDSVSVCLSKGLGAPMGSVLVGSQDFIAAARRWRKMLGGGMRQAGIAAAAGIYALEHHRQRITDDHDMALAIHGALAEVDGVEVLACHTNMVFCDFSGFDGDVEKRFEAHGIIGSVHPERSRLVTLSLIHI